MTTADATAPGGRLPIHAGSCRAVADVTDDCAANVLLSLRERTAGRPLAEREEYIGRATRNR